MRRPKQIFKTIAFWLILLVGGLLLAEGLLHLLCLVSPHARALLKARPGLYVSDKKLGNRPNPNYFQHDSRGWRNEKALDQASVVTLGDSMTYGVWAKRENAWPQQLGRLGGIATYNMSFSGYSPIQYLLLSDEVLELRPKLVIAAVYSGNDFWEAFNSVYADGLLPQLRTTDEDLLQEFLAKNHQASVEDAVTRLFEPHRGLKDFLSDYSEIYAILWLFKAKFIPDHTWPWYVIRLRAARFPPWEVFEHGGVRTVLTPTYRLLGLDLKDPRLREGLRLTLIALKQTNDRLKASGTRFLVLFLPTKELVVAPFLNDVPLKDPATYNRLIENEKLAWKQMRKYLAANQVLFTDALPELRRSVQAGKNPFLINHDAHPRKEGHRVIAATVLSEIRRRHLLEW